ncbi:hypothetical protein Gorai_000323 [Gossypium raimondii]|uniref:RNase H type-1 domain-containing protein n=1 Tax=Gossypium raimondii TaxID=29730 RepID=A0A7J8PD46_GOSRA|nr:hypothetical protein [Gossypium raimondii]
MLIGEGTMFQVEAKAMLEGLHLAWNKGFRMLKLKCDNALLIRLTLAGGATNSRLKKLRPIHQMLIWNWEEPPLFIRELLLVDYNASSSN